jgi:hypothetical protein
VNETKQLTREAIITEKDGKKTEIARCAETAGYSLDPTGNIMDAAGSFRTCNMVRYVELEEGTMVYLGVWTQAHLMTFVSEATAYFGIVKY